MRRGRFAIAQFLLLACYLEWGLTSASTSSTLLGASVCYLGLTSASTSSASSFLGGTSVTVTQAPVVVQDDYGAIDYSANNGVGYRCLDVTAAEQGHANNSYQNQKTCFENLQWAMTAGLKQTYASQCYPDLDSSSSMQLFQWALFRARTLGNQCAGWGCPLPCGYAGKAVAGNLPGLVAVGGASSAVASNTQTAAAVSTTKKATAFASSTRSSTGLTPPVQFAKQSGNTDSSTAPTRDGLHLPKEVPWWLILIPLLLVAVALIWAAALCSSSLCPKAGPVKKRGIQEARKNGMQKAHPSEVVPLLATNGHVRAPGPTALAPRTVVMPPVYAGAFEGTPSSTSSLGANPRAWDLFDQNGGNSQGFVTRDEFRLIVQKLLDEQNGGTANLDGGTVHATP